MKYRVVVKELLIVANIINPIDFFMNLFDEFEIKIVSDDFNLL
jgi:hypothetical protein